MASPVVVGTPTESNATADDASPFTVSRPAGVAGQLTIAIIAVDGGPTLTWPAGYTQFFAQSRVGEFRITGAYHQEDGSEGTTFDITSSASEKWAAIVYSISGAENPATQAPEATTVDGSTGTANPDPPSITPTGGSKDYLFIAAIANDGEEADDDTWGNTSPTNYTPSPPRQKATGVGGLGNTNTSLETAERALTAASEDPGTFNNDVSHTYVGATIAVHPAGAVTHEGAASITASGIVAAVGAMVYVATSVVQAAASVAANGVVTLAAAAAISASGVSAPVGVADYSAATSVSASAIVAPSGTITISAASTIGADVTIGVSGIAEYAGASSLSATGTVAAVGTVEGDVTHEGAASIAAAGTVTAAAVCEYSAASALGATGAVSASGTIPSAALPVRGPLSAIVPEVASGRSLAGASERVAFPVPESVGGTMQALT